MEAPLWHLRTQFRYKGRRITVCTDLLRDPSTRTSGLPRFETMIYDDDHGGFLPKDPDGHQSNAWYKWEYSAEEAARRHHLTVRAIKRGRIQLF